MVDFEPTSLSRTVGNEADNHIGTGSTPAPLQPAEKKPTIKYIFENQMKRADVEREFGQEGIDIFDRANTDGEDGISRQEYDVYTITEAVQQLQPQPRSVTTKSGGQATTGGAEVTTTTSESEELEPEKLSITSIQNLAIKPIVESLIPMEIKPIDIRLTGPIVTSTNLDESIQESIHSVDILQNIVQQTITQNPSQLLSLVQTSSDGKLNEIDWNSVTTLSDAQMEDCLSIIQDNTFIVGMTKDEAEQIGKLDEFNQISSDGSSITADDLRDYKIRQLQEKGYSPEQALKTLMSKEGDEYTELLRQVLSPSIDEELADKNLTDAKSINEIASQLGLDPTAFRNASPKERGRMIGQALRANFEQALNESCEDKGELQQEIERFRRGEFTKKEREQGIDKAVQDAIDRNNDSDLDHLAREALVRKYISTVVGMHLNTISNGTGEDNVSMVSAIYEELKECGGFEDVTALLAYGHATSSNNTEDDKQQIAEIVEEQTSGEIDTSTVAGYVNTNTVIKYGNEETVERFVENNESEVVQIENIARSIISAMPDSPKKETLKKVIEKSIQKIYDNNPNLKQKAIERAIRDNSRQTQTTPRGVSGPQNNNKVDITLAPGHSYMSSPISQVDIVSARKLQSSNLYSSIDTSRSVTSEDNSHARIKLFGFLNITLDDGKTICEALNINLSDLENLNFSQALNEVYELYDKMPDFIKLEFTNQIKMISTFHLCETYADKGTSDRLRAFLKKEQLVNSNYLIDYFDNTPGAYNKAPKTVQIEYTSAKNKKLYQNM